MPTLEAGQKFERYRIVRQLGSGISGESYEAEDSIIPRQVTLKLIHPWAPLPDAARRQFFRELHSTGSLTHPCLAPILDYGEVYGQLYLVRQYVSSGSLLSNDGRAWYSPPLDIEQAIRLAQQVALALQHLHTYGHIHGALTFSNLLVLHDSNQHTDLTPLLLADTGIAQFVRSYGRPQNTILPITAAPEQYQGKKLSAASDQYALAILLYFWLVGRLPFTGTPETIEQGKLTKTIPALFLLNPKVTLEQEEIIRRALSIHPEARYPSVNAFIEDLLTSLKQTTPTPLPLAINTPSKAATDPDTRQAQGLLQGEIPSVETYEFPLAEQLQGHSKLPLELHEQEKLAKQEVPLNTAISDSDESVQKERSIKDTEPLLFPSEVHPMSIASLIITSPSIKDPRQEKLERERITLGRAGSSTIFLNHNSVSRHHAVLVRQGEHYLITDVDSAQGTILNGQRLISGKAYDLQDGDCIKIGDYILMFHMHVLQNTAKPSSLQAFYQL